MRKRPDVPAAPMTAPADPVGSYQEMALAAANKYNLDPDIFLRMVNQESGFNPKAASSKGAVGLGQLMPDTAAELGVDPSDPAQNLEGSARYLRQQLDRFGDYPKALAAYNAGPGAVSKYGGIPPFPETQKYVAAIGAGLGAPQDSMAQPPARPERKNSRLDLPPGYDTGAPTADGGGVGGFLGGIAKDMVEGAVGPFVAASEAGQAILSDPNVQMLPAEEQGEHQRKAFDAAVKGAAFWGSMFVGGPLMKLPMAMALRLGLAGAASGAVYEGIKRLPETMTGEVKPEEWVKDVAVAGTFAGLTGGTLAVAGPAVAQAAMKIGKGSTRLMFDAAQKVIDMTPGGRAIQAKVAEFTRNSAGHVWDVGLTSGRAFLGKIGMQPLVQQLLMSRSVGATLAGKYVAGFVRNTEGMTADEMSLMGGMLDRINFKQFEIDPLAQRLLAHGTPRTQEILQRAWAESERLQAVGEAIAKAGMQTYHPDTDEFHKFLLRDRYLPHRFVDWEQYAVDGPVRQKTILAIEKSHNLSTGDATVWVDNFSKRVKTETEDFLTDPTRFKTGASHYRIGRFANLPGFERDVSKILPQYYDSASRRLVLHAAFGPVEATEQALQKSLFQKGQLGERMAPVEGEDALIARQQESVVGDPNQMSMFSSKEMLAGKGMKKTPVKPPSANTMEEIIAESKIAHMREARKAFAIQSRYPRAFAQLALIEDPTQKRLANEIVSRQLGALQQASYGETFFSKLAKLEVITKLSLGAIAQPSQMLSAVVRTGWKGAFRNVLRTFANDPEAMDFALRAGVTLRSIVRESETSLTGGETDFLKRVLFTQMDMKSRVFGALQGASFAEHQAGQLTKFLAMKPNGFVSRKIGQIEEKLVGLGLNPAEIVKRGGHLTEDELLHAGQTVSMDVNFWGDSLELPSFFRSPTGRFITQFKSFGFQQSKLIKDHVVKPALLWAETGGKRGDIGPLTRMALTMPAGGEIITDLKKFIRGRTRDDPPVARVMTNIANAAGFGLAYDAWDSLKYGTSGALGFLTGPITGTWAKAAEAGYTAAAKGDPAKLVRFSIETGLPAAVAMTPGLQGALPAVATLAPAAANLVVGEKR
jgi:hypothetical protein